MYKYKIGDIIKSYETNRRYLILNINPYYPYPYKMKQLTGDGAGRIGNHARVMEGHTDLV